MLKILVVDDHPVVRFGIKSVLQAEDEIKLVDECEDGLQAVNRVRENSYDVILLDINMPVLDGCKALQRILAYKPGQKVVMLSSISKVALPKNLMENGACGFLNKESSLSEVMTAIRQVVSGKNFISSNIAVEFANSILTDNAFDTLSKREMQTTLALANGQSISEIAQQMNVSSKTVSTYKKRIWEKLAVHSEREFFDLCLENGLIEPVAVK